MFPIYTSPGSGPGWTAERRGCGSLALFWASAGLLLGFCWALRATLFPVPTGGLVYPYVTCCSLCNPLLLLAKAANQEQSRAGERPRRGNTPSALRVWGRFGPATA